MLEVAANTGIKQLPRAFGSLWSSASSLISKSDFLKFSERYKTYLLDNYSYVKVLGMTDPMPVKSIYTELRFLKEIPSRKYQSFEELEKRARDMVQNWHRTRIETLVDIKIEEELREEAIADKLAPLNSLLQEEEDGNRRKKLVRSQEHERHAITTQILSAPLTNEQLITKSRRYAAEIEIAMAEAVEEQLLKSTQEFLSPLSLEDRDTLSPFDILKKKSRVLVLGKPGAGKSTFIKHVLLEHIGDKFEESKFPLIVVLREYIDSPFDTIVSYLANEFESSGFPNPMPFIGRVMRKKNGGILLLDGLDEVPAANQVQLIAEINSIQKKYKNLQLIVSSRLASYKGQLSGFSEFELSDLRSQDIRDFSRKWFGDKQDLYTSFLRDITGNFGLRELTTTPLLLTLLCISYKRNLRFPEQKSLLYLNCIDTLFIDWDSSRQISRPRYLEQFDVESKKFVLGKVAYDTFCSRTLIMYKQELIGLLQNAGKALPTETSDGALMLREFIEHHGILLERSKGVYSFSHLTLQEFFNALHISKYPSIERFTKLSELFLVDDRWRETILFLAGLLPKSDQLLLAIADVGKTKIAGTNSFSSVMQNELPSPALEYLEQLDSRDDTEYWQSWFRCRMSEYILTKSNYVDLDFNRASLPMNQLAYAIQELGHLNHSGKQDLTMSKPINRLLTECYKSKVVNNATSAMRKDISIWEEYFQLMELGTSILLSRARCSPNTKRKFVVEMFSNRKYESLSDLEEENNLLGI